MLLHSVTLSSNVLPLNDPGQVEAFAAGTSVAFGGFGEIMKNCAAVTMHPIFLEPKIEPRVWGGDRLATEFGRALPDEPVGESWEIHGDLTVSGTNQTLDQLAEREGKNLLGKRLDGAAGFPLLTKWLDCRAWLSVQVHPDDSLARQLTQDPTARGKTEAWYVHKAAPDAELIHGLADGVTVDQMEAAEGGAILGLLKRFHPRSGQLLFTAAGVVHALGPGNLIYEVQQSCDLTYRLYDWGRDRTIHPDKAVRCAREAGPTPSRLSDDRVTCPFFDIQVFRRPEEWEVTGDSFEILATTGSCVLKWSSGSAQLPPGRSVLIPAGLGEVRVDEVEDAYLRVSVPESFS